MGAPDTTARGTTPRGAPAAVVVPPSDALARLVGLVIAFAIGVLIAEQIRPPPVVCSAIPCVVLLARRRASVVLLIGALGLCLAGLRLGAVEHSALGAGARHGADALIEGDLLDDALETADSMRVVVGVRRVEVDRKPLEVRERVLLTLRPPPTEPLHGGQRIQVDARLRPLGVNDPAFGASARRLERKGIAARAFASAGDLRVIGRSGAPLSVIAEAGRASVRRVADRLPERHRGLLLGVTIGDVSLLPSDVDLDFRITGLSHLVAVSGANVALVLALVAACARAARAGPRFTAALLAATVLCFMAITRFEPSVLRAGVMASIGLLGVVVGARRRAMETLAASVLILLMIDPFLVHSFGFQLSVLATAGILQIAPRVAARLPDGPLGAAFAISMGAQLAVAPLIVLKTGTLSLVSLAANLVVGPAVGPATLIGIVAAIAAGIRRPLGAIGLVVSPLIGAMQWAAHALSELPLASLTLTSGAVTIAVAALLGFGAHLARRGDRRLAVVMLAAVFLATTGAWASSASKPGADDGLRITMLDVGQGDAILVRCGDSTMLVDGGPDPRRIVADLRREGVRRVDLLVTTHPHQDHVAGLTAVAQMVPVARLIDPFIEDDLPAYRDLLATATSKGIVRDQARAGMRYRLGCATVDVLWPPRVLMVGTPADINNNSIVMRVASEGKAILLAGETQEEAQTELLRRRDLLRADVLKVSHHGSRHMIPAFYSATRAAIALVPVGANSFGHPSPITLAALRPMRVLTSRENGTVTVALKGREPWVVAERGG